MSTRLENISTQLTSLTRVVLGLSPGHHDDTGHNQSYQVGLGHPDNLTDFREKSVMREIGDDDTDHTDDNDEDPIIADDSDDDESEGKI